MSTHRLAVSVMPLENRRETLLGLAQAADRRGYHGFYLPETWACDVTVLLAEAALRTEQVGRGTGIASVWARSPGTLAMAAAPLARMRRIVARCAPSCAAGASRSPRSPRRVRSSSTCLRYRPHRRLGPAGGRGRGRLDPVPLSMSPARRRPRAARGRSGARR